ncbi:MAG: TetR/AcrR family transcriptional regulator [Myxococcales bacterium]
MARPRSEDLVPRIVRAARARFLAEGVDGASLRKIASAARTSVGMVFYYFPAKDDLFLASIEEVYAGVASDLTLALSGPEPLRERLERSFVRLGTLTGDELAVLRLMIREALLSSKRLRRVLARAQRGHLEALVAALAEGQARGELDPRLPLPLVVAVTIGLGGFPQLIRRTLGEALPELWTIGAPALARAATALLFKAVGPAPKRPGPGRQRSR